MLGEGVKEGRLHCFLGWHSLYFGTCSELLLTTLYFEISRGCVTEEGSACALELQTFSASVLEHYLS